MAHTTASCTSRIVSRSLKSPTHEESSAREVPQVARSAAKGAKALLRGGSFPASSLFAQRSQTVASRRGALSVRAAEQKANGFNPDTMEVLGIPGVKIVPEDTLSKEVLKTGSSASQAERFATGSQTGTQENTEKDIALELEWDPEGLLGPLKKDADTDHIQRRLLARQAEQKEKLEKEAKEEYEAARKELEEFRASRIIPENDPQAMLNYMLETEYNEIEFESVRCKSQLNAEFFAYVETQIKATEDEGYAEKLRTVSTSIRQFTQFVDGNVKALAAPADRMRKLLTAKDKKEMISQMGANGEIDTAFLALLQTNINGATQAGQADAALFMQKVFNACSKFVES